LGAPRARPSGSVASRERGRGLLPLPLLVLLLALVLVPEGPCWAGVAASRGEFLRRIVEARGFPLVRSLPPGTSSKTFDDIPPGSDLYPYALTACYYGLIPSWGGHFNPGLPISWGEAVYMALYSLGLGKDLEVISRVEGELVLARRGDVHPLHQAAIYVAERFLRPSWRGIPEDGRKPMSRGDLDLLISSYLATLRSGIDLSARWDLSEGLSVLVGRRGVLRSLPMWRVDVGSYSSQPSMARAAEAIRRKGIPFGYEVEDENYLLYAGPFKSAIEARRAREVLGEGIISSTADAPADALSSPVAWVALEVDPRVFRVSPLLPRDGLGVLRPLETMARDSEALGAVNGGFFRKDGEAVGLLVLDGVVVREPYPGRTAFGVRGDGSFLVGVPGWRAFARLGGRVVSIDGVNRRARLGEVVLFTPHRGMRCDAPVGSTELVVRDGVVAERRVGGKGFIPRDGLVLVGAGAGTPLEAAQVGERVEVVVELFGPGGERWDDLRWAVQGGPLVLADGVPQVGDEGFPHSFCAKRHPRTLLGVKPNGRLLMLVVDGRDPIRSFGVTLYEAALLAKELGCLWALNLDGGGSSTSYLGGKILNNPSDGKPRPIAYGVGVWTKDS